MEDRHLISVDELRAAGALDVPAAWRKLLHVERDLSPGLFDNHDADAEQQATTRVDGNDECRTSTDE